MNLLLPDGVDMEVPIEYLAVKDSVFIPTLKSAEVRYLIRKVAKEIEIGIEMSNVVEDGYLGVMVWRTR